MNPSKQNGILIQAWRHALLPALFYSICFILLTYPLILNFGTHFFTDDGDGLMGVWNLWWVDHAAAHPAEYSSFWQTDMLHQPFGITLLGHTLAPVNGLVASLLLRFMPLLEAHNLIVIFSFVMSGVSAYWLAYYFTRSGWGSLAAGYLFTFSAYHFAHYDGHLNLITLEWIPLFVLCFYILISKPKVWIGAAAAISLWLVLLSDFYYLFYCLLLAGLMVLMRMIEERDIRFFTRSDYAASLAVFCLLSFIFLAPVIFPLIMISVRDPFLGGHDPAEFSLDLFSIFIPGERWRFGASTGFFWQDLPGDPAEISVFPGWSILLLLGYLFIIRKTFDNETRRQAAIWLPVMGFFLLMALGPQLQVNGQMTGIPMPYALMEAMIPFIKISGVPVRMIVMTVLAGSVLGAIAINELILESPRRKFFLYFIFILLVVESLPAPLPSTAVETPGYVQFLADLPDDGAALDLAAPTQYLHLYYQTIHEKPLVFGYTARIPSSLFKREKDIRDAIVEGNYRKLWDAYRIRYVVTSAEIDVYEPHLQIHLIYEEDGVRVYRLETR